MKGIIVGTIGLTILVMTCGCRCLSPAVPAYAPPTNTPTLGPHFLPGTTYGTPSPVDGAQPMLVSPAGNAANGSSCGPGCTSCGPLPSLSGGTDYNPSG